MNTIIVSSIYKNVVVSSQTLILSLINISIKINKILYCHVDKTSVEKADKFTTVNIVNQESQNQNIKDSRKKPSTKIIIYIITILRVAFNVI